jgi:DNA-directed RNA polymerase subunit A"
MHADIPYRIVKEVDDYAARHKLTDDRKAQLIERIREVYRRSMYNPEEPVGIVAAQSLSEPATQMTMRTYHFAGTAGIQVTLGLPRMIEIFDARKEPRTPTMTVYISRDHQDIESVRKIAELIKEVRIKDIVTATTIDLTEMWIKCDLDAAKVKEFEIEVDKLPKKLKIRGADVKAEGNSLYVVSKKEDIGGLHKMKYALLETHIRGIKGVSQVVVSKEGGEWVISTLGSNLKRVFEIEGVDSVRTTSNNIFEIADVLGIEAARNAIIWQAQYTMEEQGLGVDVRYVMLLADLMTVDGQIKAIGRYGISGQKASVLVRASFEETKKHFVGASIRGERDELKGAIENIMMNQVAPLGTGAFRLVGRIPEWPEEASSASSKSAKATKTGKPAKPAKAAAPKASAKASAVAKPKKKEKAPKAATAAKARPKPKKAAAKGKAK